MIDWKAATNTEVLAAWDAGEPVWSCSMGGIGDGYEQCIQNMGFEMLRAMFDKPPEDWSKFDGEDGRKLWQEYRDEIDKVPSVAAVVDELGPSGAQHGAAMNLASVFSRNGYANGMEMVPENRRIKVTKKMPPVLTARQAFEAGRRAAEGDGG
jgi:hypothetical protein